MLRRAFAATCRYTAMPNELSEWRRTCVRHVIERVEVREHDGACYDIRVTCRDGVTAKLVHRHRTHVSHGELAAVGELRNDPTWPRNDRNTLMVVWLRERGLTGDWRRLYRPVDSARHQTVGRGLARD